MVSHPLGHDVLHHHFFLGDTRSMRPKNSRRFQNKLLDVQLVALDPVRRAMVFSLFMHILHRGIPKSPSPQLGGSTFQALHCNPRGKKVGNLAVVFEHPAEEYDHVPVTPKTPSRWSMFHLRRKPAPEYPRILSQTPASESLRRSTNISGVLPRATMNRKLN